MKSSQGERSEPKTLSQPVKSTNLFPSLLVIPDLGNQPKGARQRARRRGREATWGVVEMIWAYFSFLDAGAPFRAADQQRLIAKAVREPWTTLHASYAGYMHAEIHRYVRLLGNNTPLSRGILKLSELVKVGRNSQYSSTVPLEQLSRVAKHVHPDRMSLPSKAGIIDPKEFLKDDQLEAFTSMLTQVPHNVTPAQPTVGCFKVAPEHLHSVNHKLLSSGVATLIPESMALRDSDNNIISGGLFAVDHKKESDRIILDRRPFNELERRLVWARLPHGSLLTQLILPKGFSIRGSGDDLSNYFYLLQHLPEWLPRNAIGKPFDGTGYEAYGGVSGQKYMLSFKVIAMGDLNAVDIAQQVHFEILRDGLCMQPGECIEFKQPLPASHTLEGLYIDDHIVTQILPSKKLRPPVETFRDEEIMRKSREQYQKHGVPTSAHKAFDKESRFVAWGTEVDSKSGRVGTPLLKLSQLAGLIARVCKLQKVGKKLLQSVTGLLIHPLMHRRSLMCVLQDTFIWCEKMDDTTQKPLPHAVKEELLCCALLLPMCHSNIRWAVSTRIGASDASSTHGGRAATLVTPSISQTLYRYSEHKGEHVRLDWEKGGVQLPSEMHPAPKELEELLLDLPWNATESCEFNQKQHINILETKMIYRELKDLVHQSKAPLRCVLLCDSRAATGAWSKGRSSSRNLNRVLRQSLGWTLAGRKSIHIVWVRSGANPSDHPSRKKKIPEPPVVPTSLTQEVLGEKLNDLRARRSNRSIWRAVEKFERQSGAGHVPETSRSVLESSKIKSEASECAGGGNAAQHPACSLWCFREIFAGQANLTKVFRRRKCFRVLDPVELMKKGVPDLGQDILEDKVFEKLCREAAQPKQLWHFGFPCGSFSIMQNMNKGTRSKQNPLGDGSLKRERDGNLILERTLVLCRILHENGSFFTLENPHSSFAWHTPQMTKVIAECNCDSIVLDQCEYGLVIPDDSGNLKHAQKPTRFVGTMPHLCDMSRRCTHDHEHVAVLGGVKVQGRWQKRSQLAGCYPLQLCQSYARSFEKSFK